MTSYDILPPEQTGAQSEHYINIPCPRDALGQFISNLLGKPQSLEHKINCDFDIDVGFIKQLDALLMQRLKQQNISQVLSFTCKVAMEEGFSRELRSIDELISYNETKIAGSIGAVLTWVFLIKFPDREALEKQIVTIEIDDGSLAGGKDKTGNDFSRFGTIKIAIEYTERTLADDIENMMSNYILQIVSRISQIRQHFAKFSLVYTMLSGMLISMSVGNYSNKTFKYLFSSAWNEASDVMSRLEILFNAIVYSKDRNTSLESVIYILTIIISR